jgi:hypothetical protein
VILETNGIQSIDFLLCQKFSKIADDAKFVQEARFLFFDLDRLFRDVSFRQSFRRLAVFWSFLLLSFSPVDCKS